MARVRLRQLLRDSEPRLVLGLRRRPRRGIDMRLSSTLAKEPASDHQAPECQKGEHPQPKQLPIHFA